MAPKELLFIVKNCRGMLRLSGEADWQSLSRAKTKARRSDFRGQVCPRYPLFLTHAQQHIDGQLVELLVRQSLLENLILIEGFRQQSG